MITWTFRGYGGTIEFEDGQTVWLQGDDANSLDDQVEKCETQQQQDDLLDAYHPDH